MQWFALVVELRRTQDEDSKEALRERIYEGLVVLEDAFIKCSKGKPFFGGETIGYIDIAFGCFIGWLKFIEEAGDLKIFDEKRTPKLVGWTERFLSDKAIQGVIPEAQQLTEFLQMYKARQAATSNEINPKDGNIVQNP